MNIVKILVKILLYALIIVLAFGILSRTNLLPSWADFFKKKEIVIENTNVLVENITKIAELATIVYYDEVVVDSTFITYSFLGGKMPRTHVIIAAGQLKIGVDFKKAHRRILNKHLADTLSLQVPKASVLDTILNPSNIETFVDGGIDQAGRTIMANKAIKKIVENALADKVIDKSQIQVAKLLETFLKAAYPTVKVVEVKFY